MLLLPSAGIYKRRTRLSKYSQWWWRWTLKGKTIFLGSTSPSFTNISAIRLDYLQHRVFSLCSCLFYRLLDNKILTSLQLPDTPQQSICGGVAEGQLIVLNLCTYCISPTFSSQRGKWAEGDQLSKKVLGANIQMTDSASWKIMLIKTLFKGCWDTRCMSLFRSSLTAC